MTQKEFFIDNFQMQKYKIIKTIGQGSFGVVYKALAPTDQIVAIKKMLKVKYQDLQQVSNLKQIKCLKRMDHPNIIKLQQVIVANSQLFMVFDYLQCNLFQVYTRAKQSNRTLTQNQIKLIFYKTASGLAYLHKNGYFHRDLKPQNILCHNNQIKLCDFGLARQIRSRPPFTEYVATRWYRAPQLLLHGGYNSQVDIFALACIIVELYMMAPLFPGQTEIETMNKIVDTMGTPTRNQWPEGYKMASVINYNFPDRKKKELSDLIPNASLQAVQLLEKMLAYSPRKRPSASDIIKDDFFSNIHQIGQTHVDSKKQTKFSFYQNKIIQIPKNLPKENREQMQMRKSQIKFGNSFGSSFFMSKQAFNKRKQQREKQQDKEKQKDKVQWSRVKEDFIEQVADSPSKMEKTLQHKPKQKKRNKETEQHDQITKKFDEMQQILAELQKKEKKQQKRMQPIYEIQNNYEHQTPKMDSPKREGDKMMLFQFGMGSLSSLNAMKNLKNAPFGKGRVGESK